MSSATATTANTPGAQIDPRRAEPGVAVHSAVPQTELWEAMGSRGGGALPREVGGAVRNGGC